MNYAAKFSGYRGKKVVKSRRNFIYKKKEPGKDRVPYIREAEGILLSEASIRKEDGVDASKKIQIAYLELYPLESGKAYGLVRLIDIAPIAVRGVRTPRIIGDRHNNYYGFVVFTHPLIINAHCSGSSRI